VPGDREYSATVFSYDRITAIHVNHNVVDMRVMAHPLHQQSHVALEPTELTPIEPSELEDLHSTAP
jgi:hypothetical protein